MSVKDLIVLGCSSQQPTRNRNHGAYLFRWNDEGLLFDPGEGTQRQFIFANIAPPVVTRIFVSHFHGDHCLGLGSMLMRLNLDKVKHPIHCYFPMSGKKYFDRLHFGCIYHETIQVIEHPVAKEGLVEDDGKFRIEAAFLQHGTDNIGWRITEPDRIRFDKVKLEKLKIQGPLVKQLEREGFLHVDGRRVALEEVSCVQTGEAIAVVIDTVPCPQAVHLAKDASILLCESTYLEDHRDLAEKYLHMTAQQAALIAKEAGVKKLILTHFSARYQEELAFEEEARKVFLPSFAAKDGARFEFPKSSSTLFGS